ncbi:hypothetical protein SEA27A368_39960 [Salmonella enterica]|nr:hypothetical protein SEEB0208_19805 [Salmonella enterica subsp. enterica serovar Bareilly str. CFSAN000208]KFU05373.1 hypothetical protein SEEB0201_06705 [Salmonella enterica subsp. enterica serovar Bareilly str. CFSAN000201]GCE74163.1 hypothetical protein SEA27A368_39960 [Salmonella enterica]
MSSNNWPAPAPGKNKFPKAGHQAVSLKDPGYTKRLFSQRIELWGATTFLMKHGVSPTSYFLLCQLHEEPDAHGLSIVNS